MDYPPRPPSSSQQYSNPYPHWPRATPTAYASALPSNPQREYETTSYARYPERQPAYRPEDDRRPSYHDRTEPYVPQSYPAATPTRAPYASQYSGPPPPDPYSRSRETFAAYRPPEPWAHWSAAPPRTYPPDTTPYSRREDRGYGPPPPVSYAPASPGPVSARTRADPYWSRDRQRSASPGRRAHYPLKADYRPPPYNPPEVLRQSTKSSVRTANPYAQSARSQTPASSKPAFSAPSESPKTYAPLTYPIPGPARDIMAGNTNLETPLPVYPFRPPVEVDVPLGASFLDTEAIKSGVPRRYPETEKNIRDPALDIVDRKAKDRQIPPRVPLNPNDPLDGAPLPPVSSSTAAGNTPGGGREKRKRTGRLDHSESYDDPLSIERILKRGHEDQEDPSYSNAKKPHLEASESDGPPPAVADDPGHGSDKSSSSADPRSTAQNLLEIVENTLAQIRSGQKAIKK